MKRVFGGLEVIFDLLYLFISLSIGILLLLSTSGNSIRLLAGLMSIILVVGDAFHLIPRILLISTGDEKSYLNILGRGKQITSITMTLFYIFLWNIGIMINGIINHNVWTYVFYLLAIIRIFLCFLPHNKWTSRYPPTIWGIYRNIPFFLMGIMVALLFFLNRNIPSSFDLAWIAIILSFLFYLPVILWANIIPKIGMLMMPKTIAYVWLLFMCLFI